VSEVGTKRRLRHQQQHSGLENIEIGPRRYLTPKVYQLYRYFKLREFKNKKKAITNGHLSCGHVMSTTPVGVAVLTWEREGVFDVVLSIILL